MAWRKVADQESLMEDINATHTESAQEKTKLEVELQKWSNASQIVQEIQTLGTEIDEQSAVLADEFRRMNDEKATWRKKNEAIQELERDSKKAEARRDKITETIKKLDESIQNELST